MKQIISIILALVVGYIFVKLLLIVLSLTFAAVSFIFKAVMITIFALPVYIILRKSLFKK